MVALLLWIGTLSVDAVAAVDARPALLAVASVPPVESSGSLGHERKYQSLKQLHQQLTL